MVNAGSVVMKSSVIPNSLAKSSHSSLHSTLAPYAPHYDHQLYKNRGNPGFIAVREQDYQDGELAESANQFT